MVRGDDRATGPVRKCPLERADGRPEEECDSGAGDGERDDSEPAASHELAAPPQRAERGAVLELDDLCEECPASYEPDGQREKSHGDAQDELDDRDERDGADEPGQPFQRVAVCRARRDGRAGIDAHERPSRRGLHDGECRHGSGIDTQNPGAQRNPRRMRPTQQQGPFRIVKAAFRTDQHGKRPALCTGRGEPTFSLWRGMTPKCRKR